MTGIADDGMPLADRFVAACREFSDRPALDDGTRQWTYAELLAEAESVAAAVAARTPPGAVVGLVAAKTVWSVAAQFGGVLADRTVVPLDADEPPAWWADRCALVDARLLLADDGVRIPPDFAGPPRVGPSDVPRAAYPRRFDPDADLHPFILVTSGSTGEPKLTWQADAYAQRSWRGHRERVGQGDLRDAAIPVLSPLSFGASRAPLYGGLANGLLVVLVDTPRTSPGAIVDLLVARPGPVLYLTPAMLRSIVAVADARGVTLPRPVLIEFGGGAVDTGDLVAARRAFPNATLISAYGNTEIGLVSEFAIRPGDDPTAPPPGEVMPDVRIRVVDPDGGEVGPGEAGELWAASTRSVGELLDPGQREANRRVDPDGTVWHRTGDRGCLRADGRLEIHGRADDRVKVHGAPVDLNVVAAAVAALPGVADAAVSAVDDAGDARLVAWVVMEAGQRPTVRSLRAGLTDALPRSMQPRVFRAIGEIPRTTRDKVDRVALARAAAREIPVGVAHVAPRTPTEDALAARVRAVLGVDDVGVHESFFELGGDSLDALDLVAGLVDDLALAPDRQAELEHALVTGGSVAALAAALDRPDGGSRHVELRPDGVVRLELRDGRAGDGGDAGGAVDAAVVVLVPGGGQTTVALRPLVARIEGPRVWTLLPPGFRSGSGRDTTIADLAARYADALLDAAPEAEFVVAGFSFGALVAHALSEVLVERGARVRTLALLDAGCPGTSADPAAGRTPERPGWPTRLRRNWRHLPTALRVRVRRRVGGRAEPPPPPAPGGDDMLPSEGLLWAMALAEGFDPPPLDVPALVVRSAWSVGVGKPPDLGWSRLCRGPLRTLDVAGNHLDVVHEPAVASIGAALADAAVTWGGRPRGE